MERELVPGLGLAECGAMTNHAKCGVPAEDVLLEGGRLGVLLVHRLGGGPADLEFVAQGLAQSGHTVSCPVLYGHGGSRMLLGATTWKHWYTSVVDAHRELTQRCDLVVVGGLGVGALLALHLAAEKQTAVHGVVLFAPTFWPDGWAQPWFGRLLRMLESKRLASLFRLDERPPYGIKDDALRRSMLTGRHDDGRSREDVYGRSGATFVEVKWLANAVQAELGKVSQPCLIFHPRHDDRSRLSSSQRLQKQLGGIVDLVVLEDSYHLVTLDRQREVVLDRVREFAHDLPALAKQPSGRPNGSAPVPAR